MNKFAAIARPYSNAIFDLAIKYEKISHWKNILEYCSLITKEKMIIKLLSRNYYSHNKIASIFIDICKKKLCKHSINLIKIMSENKRLMIFPCILKQFIILCEKIENIERIKIYSSITLKKNQIKKICSQLNKKLSKKIIPYCIVDKSIISGLIISIKDTIIDKSINYRLTKFSKFLKK